MGECKFLLREKKKNSKRYRKEERTCDY